MGKEIVKIFDTTLRDGEQVPGCKLETEKKVEIAIDKSDKALAEEAFKIAQPEMHKSVSKGVFKKNTISRKLSRLSSRIKNIA